MGENGVGVEPVVEPLALEEDAHPKHNNKHVLQNSWTVWYDSPQRKVSQQNWSSFIKRLHVFHTVEDFWCLYNNIAAASQLVVGSNYHVFKEGIEPKWEDPANDLGGRWILVVPRSHRAMVDDFWLKAVLSLIGENFVDSEQVCGCVVSIRKSGDKIAVWTSRADDAEAVLRIGAQIRTLLEIPPDMTIAFQAHRDAKHSGSLVRYEL